MPMPTLDTLTPAQVARRLGVHVNTVRSWTSEYADVLSDGAKSRPRLLSPSDVATLQLVQTLRAEGLSPSDVLQRLRETPPADRTAPFVDGAPTPTEAATETPTTSLAHPLPSDLAALAALLRDMPTQEDVKSVSARVARLETQQETQYTQRLLWAGVAVGLVLLGVAVGVIVAFVLLR